jgi:hypothetical protein
MEDAMRVARISTVLVCALFGTSCVGAADEPSTGELSVNLVGQATSGSIYRLRDATITVTGPATATFNTEDDPNRTSLSANVVTGDYAATLQPGWRLERVTPTTTTPVVGTLTSSNPAPFSVSTHQRTTVPLQFHVDQEVVDMTQGYDIVLVVDDSPRSCVNNPQWQRVDCTTSSWVWSSNRAFESLATANAAHTLETGCQHASIPTTCSTDGQGWVSTQVFTMVGCNTSWAHITPDDSTFDCGGHDGDQYRHLSRDDNSCFAY